MASVAAGPVILPSAGGRAGFVVVEIRAEAPLLPPPQVPAEQQVRTFVDTSNHGTLRMIRGFRPLLNDCARFIAVASSFGMPVRRAGR